MPNSRRLSSEQLREALAAARARLLDWSFDLDEAQWRVPFSWFIQPTAWDLCHVGWFAEFWLLRGPHRLRRDGLVAGEAPPTWFGPDEHFDSAVVEHAERWRLPPRERSALRALLEGQLAAAQERVRAAGDDEDTRYFAHLSVFHELMHTEALAWTRASCGYPAPAGAAMRDVPVAEQVRVDAGPAAIGCDGVDDFGFDNEAPRHEVRLGAFAIDSHPVRNDAFLAFVDDGGYERPELWPHGPTGEGRQLPARWRRAADGSVEHRHYDRWLPLPPAQPVVHVNAREAEAFCRWAGRRLPTAAEWEAASARIDWGRSVWEWTASTFAPYTTGFRPGPYVTYSTPWFHHQRELRGGAYTTHALMHDARYRNFFLPERKDVFAGFRTAADA